MSAASAGLTPWTRIAFDRLRDLPSLRMWNAECGRGAALRLGELEIVHLPPPDVAEVCLTWPVIERLGPPLWEHDGIRVRPGTDWVEMVLYGQNDVGLLVSLTSVAIQAHTRAGPVGRRRRPLRPTLCPRISWQPPAISV